MARLRPLWQAATPRPRGSEALTLLLSNEEVDGLLQMPDCMEAMEGAFRAIGDRRAANAGRCEILTPTARDDALYSLLNMNGVVPELGIGAVRINSDILTWPASPDGLKRVKVPAAPNERYVGLVLLFSTTTGEPLAIYPDGVVQRMRIGATSGLAAKYLARPDARAVGAARHRLAGRQPGDGDLRGAPDRADRLLQPARGEPARLCGRDERAARHRGAPPRPRRARRCAAPTWCCARPTACSRCCRSIGSSPACM